MSNKRVESWRSKPSTMVERMHVPKRLKTVRIRFLRLGHISKHELVRGIWVRLLRTRTACHNFQCFSIIIFLLNFSRKVGSEKYSSSRLRISRGCHELRCGNAYFGSSARRSPPSHDGGIALVRSSTSVKTLETLRLFPTVWLLYAITNL